MKPAPYPGLDPTIAQLREFFGWVWACCGLPCSHRAAIPLARVIDRLGASSPADALRKRLRCTKCGRLGVTIRTPSADCFGYAPLPVEMVPAALRGMKKPAHLGARA
jgi:hypothetical protein